MNILSKNMDSKMYGNKKLIEGMFSIFTKFKIKSIFRQIIFIYGENKNKIWKAKEQLMKKIY